MMDKVRNYLRENPFILILLIIFLVGSAGYGIYQIVYHTNNAKHQDAYEKLWENAVVNVMIPIETEEQEEEKHIPTPVEEFLAVGDNQIKYGMYLREGALDFEVLWEYNQDVVGYIMIPGTKVSYPILRSEDNEYYLHHNMDGSRGYPGCIYMENYNAADFEDSLTILYGHNMRNNSMFGTLEEYKFEEYRLENPYIIIYLPEETRVYEVVVTSKYSNEHLLADNFIKEADDTFTFCGLNGNENLEFIDDIKDYGAYGAYVDSSNVEAEDKIIVLSTCTSHDMRYIVGAKRIL